MTMRSIRTIGFDADDTLWESEIFFVDIQKKFAQLMRSYGIERDIENCLYVTEKTNLARFGYGVKSFTLSMIEAAHDLTDGALRSIDTVQIIQWGKELMNHPVELLPGTNEALQSLKSKFSLLVITKGDPFHQHQKFANSGLEVFANEIEVLQEKDSDAYRKVLSKRNIEPEEFLMVGNSLRSDIFPVVAIGGHAVHIPHEDTWQLENEYEKSEEESSYSVLKSIRDLPDFLNTYISGAAT